VCIEEATTLSYLVCWPDGGVINAMPKLEKTDHPTAPEDRSLRQRRVTVPSTKC